MATNGMDEVIAQNEWRWRLVVMQLLRAILDELTAKKGADGRSDGH